MFTGLIEEVGTVQTIASGKTSSVLTISGAKIFDDLQLGDSVAVNGVCLTASALTKNTFSADIMHETLRRSSLGTLVRGSRVNLERALPANGRFGGHIVQGHIDGCGTIVEIKREGNAFWYRIKTDDIILRYAVAKGSIAIDGISLTIADLDAQGLRVSVIPHTRDNTALSQKTVGDTVNLETDVLGKYIERFLLPNKGNGKKNSPNTSSLAGPGSNTNTSFITSDFLSSNGF